MSTSKVISMPKINPYPKAEISEVIVTPRKNAREKRSMSMREGT